MDNKVNAYLHNCLAWLAEDCLDIVKAYDEKRRYRIPEEAKAEVMSDIKEDIEDIEKALEVFQNAEMMVIKECGVARSAAHQMKREAKTNLRRHMEQKGEWK